MSSTMQTSISVGRWWTVFQNGVDRGRQTEVHTEAAWDDPQDEVVQGSAKFLIYFSLIT